MEKSVKTVTKENRFRTYFSLRNIKIHTAVNILLCIYHTHVIDKYIAVIRSLHYLS